MYNPPTFLTKEILIQVLNVFEWPASYEIHEEDCSIDGIEVKFPKCTLYFEEGFESEMRLSLANPLSVKNKYWTAFDLIHYIYAPICENSPNFQKPNYRNYFSAYATKEKVIFGLMDLCLSLQTYLLPCIKGDFSLANNIEMYKLDKN